MSLVLFIDDEPDAIKYYTMALRDANFEIKFCESSDKTVAYLADEESPKPDIIILDIMLPPGKVFKNVRECSTGMNTGILLCDLLRNAYPKTPVIGLSNLVRPKNLFQEKTGYPLSAKLQLPPFELVEKVKAILKHPSSEMLNTEMPGE